MIRHLESRLRKLETAALPPAFRPRHMIGGTNDQCEAQRQAMIASGHADETDDFIFLIPVSPPVCQ